MLLRLNHCMHWLVLLGLVARLRGQVLPRLLLAGQSYKLNYQVGHGSAAYEVEELHSAWQGRSKIHYKLFGKEERSSSNTFYSDGKLVLAMNPDAHICHQVSSRVVDQWLYDVPDSLSEEFGDNHLIGAGKLLSFITTNTAAFSLVNADLKEPVPEIRFRASIKLVSGMITVSLSYHKDQSQNLPCGIPRNIMVKLERTKKLVVFEFTRYQKLNDRFQSSALRVAGANQYADFETNSASYDLFFVNRAIGCSKGPDFEKFVGQSAKLFDYDLKRFSFTSKPSAGDGAGLVDMSVVYEPSLSMLRVDQEVGTSSLHSIIDSRADRKIHFIEQRNNKELETSSIARFKRDRSCIVGRVASSFSNPSSSSPFTFGQMLFGVDHLVYLGLARVRGIEAKVFEAHDCDWPVWLQPPPVYEQWDEMQPSKGNGSLDGKFSLKRHEERTLMAKQRVSMTNVFYFANTDIKDFDFIGSQLLLVEMFLRDERSGEIIKQSTFPIYGFSWDLARTNPVGERYENSFSLKDNCLAAPEESDFASINLSFEARARSDQLEWLQDSTKRNLAILSLAQTKLFHNPVSIIYDIESRLEIGNEVLNPDRPKPDREISIAVSMRAAERTHSFVRNLFICMANPRGKRFESFVTNNFHSCHNTAAHRQVDTFMAFNVRTFECLVMRDEIARERNPNELIGEICKFGQTDGNFVVYQILHHDKWEGGSRYVRLGIDGLFYIEEIKMSNPMETRETKSAIKLRLTSYDSSQMNTRVNYDSEAKHLVGDKKFPGFGLLWTEPQNKPFELQSNQGDHQVGVMKFEDCQTACLADFECRSFSVCVTGGQMDCVLSTVSFSTPSIVDQMTKLADAKYKFGEKSQIRVDLEEQNSLTGNDETASHGELVTVTRYPTCELHNKIYRDYFEQRPGWTKFCSKEVVYRPVAHMDQCAELCFRNMVDFLREMSRLEAKYSSHVEKDHKAMAMKKACTVYYFIGKEQLTSVVSEALDKQLAEDGHQKFVSGFCVLDEGVTTASGENEAVIKHEALKELTFGVYYFQYLTLYEKEAGISLASSTLTHDARVAIVSEIKEAISKGLPVKETSENLGQLEECRSSLRAPCLRECAEMCFNSVSGEYYLKCRSFDYIEIDNPERKTRRICALNSVTLKSTLKAERLDLINRGSKIQTGLFVGPIDTVRVWHYEPREGIVADSQKFEPFRSSDWVSSSGVHLGSFGLFLVVVVLFSAGMASGFVGGTKLLSKGRTEEIDGLFENPGYRSDSSRIDMNNVEDLQ